jgi:hypothetical protein
MSPTGGLAERVPEVSWEPGSERVRWIALPGVGRDVHDRVRELAVEEAYRRYGVTPGDRGVPPDRLAPQVWVALVKEIAEERAAG